MIKLIEIAQKKFKASITFEYCTGILPGSEYCLRVENSETKTNIDVRLGTDLHAAIRRFQVHADIALGKSLSTAIINNVVREFDMPLSAVVDMHMANLTSEERQMMTMDMAYASIGA